MKSEGKAEYLQDQISTRMKDRKLSARSVEKMAGLRSSAVSNILAGKSLNPSIGTLFSIANIFGCSIDELVGNKSYIEKEDNYPVHTKPIQNKLEVNYPWNESLYHDALNTTEKIVMQKNIVLNSEKMLRLIREIYLYSLKAHENTVDKKFAQWIIDNQC